MSDRCTIGVVVVTYNSEDQLQRLVRSLPAGLEGLDASVLFVDNASTDDSVKIVRESGYEAWEASSNRGYAAAVNIGLRWFHRADAVLVLNPDTELAPGAAKALLEPFADAQVGITVPMIESIDCKSLNHSLRRDPSVLRTWATALMGEKMTSRICPELTEVVLDDSEYANAHDVDWATGAALMIRRRCIEDVGEWDESFFLYSEEVDYCQRTRAAGLVVRFTPLAMVRHEGGGGIDNPALRQIMVRSRITLFSRNHRRYERWAFLGGVLINEGLRGLFGNAAARSAAMMLIRGSLRR